MMYRVIIPHRNKIFVTMVMIPHKHIIFSKGILLVSIIGYPTSMLINTTKADKTINLLYFFNALEVDPR